MELYFKLFIFFLIPRMSSAAVMPIFLPDSQGAPLTERPSVKNSGNRLRSGRNGPPSSLGN